MARDALNPPSLQPEDDYEIQELVRRLQARNLVAHVYRKDGRNHVHVSPPGAPSAGTDLSHIRNGEERTFATEFGSCLSGGLEGVIASILSWFGKRRP